MVTVSEGVKKSTKISSEETVNALHLSVLLKKVKVIRKGNELLKTLNKRINKLGLSWAKLSHSWGLKLELKVEV